MSELQRLGEILQECLDGREQDYPSKILLAGHDFQFERRPITGGWDTGMWCSRCGSRMNHAQPACPGRKTE
ncbi:MAG TPA: hypothetical protein VJQ82_17945 [Terriglobales bacterium]|nr:hypothetical protein [Terriglobales bacterium]